MARRSAVFKYVLPLSAHVNPLFDEKCEIRGPA
jgi:hypothetical protein